MDGQQAWNNLHATERDTLINNAALDTAQAVQAGAVLLSHLKNIKSATAGANHDLLEAGHI